jgi:predicted O-methyltransferase YrrM
MAAALRHAGGGRLTTVDIVAVNAPDGPWAGAGAPAAPRAMLERLGLDPLVSFVQSRSDRFLAAAGEAYDLIWIDGNHAEVPAFFDMRGALGRVAPGGVIILHDFYAEGAGNPGVRRAAGRLGRSAPWLRVERLGAFPWDPSFASSLAICTRTVRGEQSNPAIEETGS